MTKNTYIDMPATYLVDARWGTLPYVDVYVSIEWSYKVMFRTFFKVFTGRNDEFVSVCHNRNIFLNLS